MSYAILIAGHGSRDDDGIREFLTLAQHFRQRQPEVPVEISFLEFARPTIQDGIDRLAAKGVQTIVVLPGVLLAAGHAKNDMASEVRRACLRYPQLDIRMGRALDVDHRMLQLCKLRYEEALKEYPQRDPQETLLLLVGRGSADPDANSNVAKVARLLQEGYPSAWSSCAYIGIARPLLEEALPVCERSGFGRIVVQPYFLFTGILLKRIYAQIEARRQARPDMEIIATPHLQAHPLLIDAFLARVEEALNGSAHMNCSLCKYRVSMIGHEGQVGEPQQPHHHHVQGMHGHVHRLDEHHHHHHHHHHPVDVTQSDEDAEIHPWSGELLEQLKF